MTILNGFSSLAWGTGLFLAFTVGCSSPSDGSVAETGGVQPGSGGVQTGVGGGTAAGGVSLGGAGAGGLARGGAGAGGLASGGVGTGGLARGGAGSGGLAMGGIGTGGLAMGGVGSGGLAMGGVSTGGDATGGVGVGGLMTGGVGTGGEATGGVGTGGDATGGVGTGGDATGGVGTGGDATGGVGTGGDATGGGSNADATVTVSGANPLPVASTFFGENYWAWVPDWDDPVAAVQSDVARLGLKLLRAGGANNDQQDPIPFSFAEMDGFVSYARAVGAEPLLQLPLLKSIAGGTPTAQDSADAVAHLNVTQSSRVRYFSIGNEPDLYTEQGFADASYSAATYCNTFSEHAAAMKAVDSTIMLFGPELSWHYVSGNDWLTPFLQDCGNLVDVVTIHRYPFDAAGCTDTGAYADAPKFRQLIDDLRAIMDATGQGNKPLAITEANITWDGKPENPKLSASPQSFPAGLWVADTMGVALEEELFSLDFWSMSEGYTLGIFSGTTPTPSYYAIWLYGNKFGTQVLSVAGAPSGISVYAGRDPNQARTSVFVINKTQASIALELALQDLPRTDSPVVTVEPISILVAELPDNGSTPTLTAYTANMSAPTVVAN